LKRVYEQPDAGDGTRVLVDRLWPRGISRERAAADLWLQDAGPSDALRKWYGHDPKRWEPFRRRYRAELAARTAILSLLDELRRRGPLTLIYGARDTARNNAVVLREVLEAGLGEAAHAQEEEEQQSADKASQSRVNHRRVASGGRSRGRRARSGSQRPVPG
jgi:uncharacterized protein YeaO (DUF488 family)